MVNFKPRRDMMNFKSAVQRKGRGRETSEEAPASILAGDGDVN